MTFAEIQRTLDNDLQQFLDTDLEICFRFAALAETRIAMGHHELSRHSLLDADRGYRSVLKFLSDPRHNSRITAAEMDEFRNKLARLRKRLDELESKM
jgi:hypothetical protein